jgi:FAD:protein FMN transferase
VDRAADILAAFGIESALINFGGDLRALRAPPDASAWTVAIRGPKAGSKAALVGLERVSLATSGDYGRCITIDGQRYGHILDPQTGWPVSGLQSVSVLGETCLIAGSLATIGMLMGARGKDWLSERTRAHLWVDADGAIGGSMAVTVSDPGSLRPRC